MNQMHRMKARVFCAVCAALLGLCALAAAEGLPAWSYAGDDPVEAAVAAYMMDSGMADMYGAEEGDTAIPAPVILRTAETDDGHMTVWGNFWMFRYALGDGVLVCISGGEAPGIMTLEQAEGGWKGTALETAGDGEAYGEDIARFCEGDAELEEAYYTAGDGSTGLLEAVRTRFIRAYVEANALAAAAYQDPYWDPIPLFPMEGPIKGSLEEDGSYVIRVPVHPGEAGAWSAYGPETEDAAAALASAGLEGDAFIARYVPVHDGSATVTLRHHTGIACDQVQTFDLLVADGRITDVTGGGIAYTPPGDELDAELSGRWTEQDVQFTELALSRNPLRGWQAEIVSPMTREACVLRANVYYDCELGALVYTDGTRWEMTSAGYASDEDLGEPSATGLSGQLTLSADAEGRLVLIWHRDAQDAQDVSFVRAE